MASLVLHVFKLLACTALKEKGETEWMLEHRSVYPYGLNDRCKGKDWPERGQGESVSATLFKN